MENITDKLPKLTQKENDCLMHFLTQKCSQVEAFATIYGKNSNKNTLYKGASQFFNSPKIKPWLEVFNSNVFKTVQEELNYSAIEHFRELDNLKTISLMCLDKNGNPNISSAIKAEELKGRVAGLYNNKEEQELNGGTITVMGDIKLNSDKLEFKVGQQKEVQEVEQDTESSDS